MLSKVTVSKILTPLIAMRLPRQIDKVVLEYLIRLAVLVATTSVLLTSNKSTFNICASAVTQLKVARLSHSAINGFVSSMEEMVTEIHSQAQDAALHCLPSQDTTTKRKLEHSFQNLENPFTLKLYFQNFKIHYPFLNSEAKRKRLCMEKWGIIEPSEIVLGTRFDRRRNKTTGTFDQVVVTDKFAYIPILETLKAILLTDLFKPRHVPKEGIYVDLK